MEKLLKNEPMTDYRLEISGVHYGANGDSVFGQKDTEEMGITGTVLLIHIGRNHESKDHPSILQNFFMHPMTW